MVQHMISREEEVWVAVNHYQKGEQRDNWTKEPYHHCVPHENKAHHCSSLST